jgi:hypothetical protein
MLSQAKSNQQPSSLPLRAAFFKAKYELIYLLAQYPMVFMPVARLRKKWRVLLASRQTEIVIEGFPRSGNTFAVVAFELAQGRPVVIARHSHAPAQVIWAVRRNIPALVLIRKPGDAVLSLVIRHPYLSIVQALKLYIRFYRKIRPYRDRFVLAAFNEIVANYGTVIERINSHFGTSFSVFEPTEDNINKCFELVEQMDREDTNRSTVTEATVARPSEAREQAKERLRARLEEPGARNLVATAEAIYDEMTNDCR